MRPTRRATAAGSQAQQASGIAQEASGHVDQLNSSVSGGQVPPGHGRSHSFSSGSAVCPSGGAKAADPLALGGPARRLHPRDGGSIAGGGAPASRVRSVAEAVKRYLLTEHQISVYRMRYVALGNAEMASTGEENSRPVRTSESARAVDGKQFGGPGAAPPQGVASSTGAMAVRPSVLPPRHPCANGYPADGRQPSSRKAENQGDLAPAESGGRFLPAVSCGRDWISRRGPTCSTCRNQGLESRSFDPAQAQAGWRALQQIFASGAERYRRHGFFSSYPAGMIRS